MAKNEKRAERLKKQLELFLIIFDYWFKTKTGYCTNIFLLSITTSIDQDTIIVQQTLFSTVRTADLHNKVCEVSVAIVKMYKQDAK